MEEKIKIEKSLIEQIFDEMFADIEKQSEFNPQIIQKLKELAKSGRIKKPRDVVDAIKLLQGEPL